MPRAHSILLVAQLAPPSSLSGARRPANLIKYLSQRGHRVSVLTSLASGSGPIDGSWKLVRTRDVLSSRLNWRRSHFAAIEGREQAAASGSSWLESIIVPDLALVGWLPFALPRALSLAHQGCFDCVITTSPPPSTHFVGWLLSRAGLPWIADLRDGWTFDPPHPPWPTSLQRGADRALERAILARADRLVAVTSPIADDLGRRLGQEVAVISNGFDPEEVVTEDQQIDGLLEPAKHTLVHTGRAAVSGRSPRPFLEGLIELRRSCPRTAERLDVVFAGPTTTQEREMLADPRLGGIVRSVGALERPRALALQRAADSLLVLAAGASVRSVATNKLFEYLSAGRPVLVIGQDSEAARIVRETGAGVIVQGDDDPKAVAAALRRLVDGEIEVQGRGLERFAWPALAVSFEHEVEAVRGSVERRRRC